MATLTLSEARKTMSRGRPWTFRLEYSSGTSDKFWLCTGRGRNEPVEVHYGRIGSKPQILVKDWAYVEHKTPEKVAKGYAYAPTPFVKVRQATIDAFVASQTGKPIPAPAPAPKPKSIPTPALKPPPDLWRCDKGGVTLRIKNGWISLDFDIFPAPWQGAVFQSFRDDFRAFCMKWTHMDQKVDWQFTNKVHTFRVQSISRGLFDGLVVWLKGQIGLASAPLRPPPNLTGPYAKVVQVAARGKGIWHALNALGDKVFDLTKQGAQDLVAEYPHITVAGL